MTSRIPEQLTARDQWVCWRYEKRGGKDTKVPYTPGTNRRASSVDSSTWTSFAAAQADRNYPGIGFVFSADDPFVGIDLDDCLSNGVIKPWADEILTGLPATYTEVSPSGKGLKLWLISELPDGGRSRVKHHDGEVEIYAKGRFFTVTGERYGDTPGRISHADLKPLYARLFPSRSASVPTPDIEQLGGGYEGSNEELLAAIRRSKSGAAFDRLWSGDMADYKNDHSAADQALCNLLAFWTGPNAKRIDRLFRQSGLMRDKWDEDRGEKTYGERTIDNAIADRTSFYQPADSVVVNEDSEVFRMAREGRTFAMTDVGNAKRLATHFAGRIRYCEQGGGWYVWTGSHWRRDDTGQVTFYAMQVARETHKEADLLPEPEAREKMHKHATKTEAHGRIHAMIKLAAALPGVAVPSDEFDSHPWLFNCSNGTVDLRSGEITPHNPDHNITKISPAGYHSHAVAPLWSKFLNKIFHGNIELIDYVQELLGMCLSGDISEQIMPVFYGDGSNGKSTLLDTVMAVMGTYAGKAAPDLLMARQGDVHPTEIADLWGLRLAVASETDEGRKLRVATVKEMTGDAELKARYMRGDFFNFRRTHKLVLMTNHRPRISEGKHAIWRRLKLVPFTAEISDAERDRQLGDKLRSEWMGILAWLVAGCRRWYAAGGLDDPAEVRSATEEYRDDEDPIAEFVSAKLRIERGAFATNAMIRRAYADWCRTEGIQYALSERALLDRLRERRGVKRDRRSVLGVQTRGLVGIAVIGEVLAN